MSDGIRQSQLISSVEVLENTIMAQNCQAAVSHNQGTRIYMRYPSQAIKKTLLYLASFI